jgi:hypothetical protein
VVDPGIVERGERLIGGKKRLDNANGFFNGIA